MTTNMDYRQYNHSTQAEKMAMPNGVPTVPDFELKAPNILRTDKDLNIKNKHRVTDTETAMVHGQRIKLTEVVAGAANTYFCQLSDYMIGVKDVTISRGVQLPQASRAGIGKLYVIKDMSGSAAATTIAVSPIDGETIDGDIATSLNTNYATKRVHTDGTNWFSW